MLTRVFKTTLLLAMFAAPAAQAAIIFTDNFDTEVLATNSVPSNWLVSDGSVDVIGDPSFFNFLPGNGRYVDLDGSTGNSGVLKKAFNLTAGTLYTVSFDLAGSQRGSNENVTVNFGTSTNNWSFTSGQGFATYSLTFNPTLSGAYLLSFENAGGDNVGALLDNVSVSSVPVPGAAWLFASAVLGLLGLKRKSA